MTAERTNKVAKDCGERTKEDKGTEIYINLPEEFSTAFH
jgi:hypothetical protein